MGYDDRDDRRYYDDDRPRRPSGDPPRSSSGPRSGSGSGPRSSRPVDSSRTPSRPRPSGTPSRPRSGDTPSRGMSPGYRDTPPPRRSDRDMMRRVRDGLSGMYDAVSREVRSIGRRDNRYDDRREADYGDRRSASPSRPRRDDYGESARYSAVGDEESARYPAFDDADSYGRQPTPQRGMNSRAMAPATPANDTGRSLARRVIDRRKRLRPQNPILRGCLLYGVLGFMILVIVGGGLGSGYAYAEYQQYADTIATLSVNRLFQTTRIYDRNGVLLYQTYGQDSGSRIYISYCQMPQSIKIATVDTEDSTFWTNPGVNFLATLRSATIDIHNQASATGASTITQQLVKLNVLSDSSKSIARKANEAVLALGVTQQYTKQKILEMYLNTIPYGRQNYGIEAAAQNYFHLQQRKVMLDTQDPFEQGYIKYYQDEGCSIPKNATSIEMSAAYQMQPWQAMLLAGIPQAPTQWDMFDNPDGLVHTRLKSGVMVNVQKQGDGPTMFKLPASGQYDPTNPGGQQMVPASPDQIATFVFTFVTATDKNKNLTNIFLGAFQNSSGQSTKLAPHFVDYVISELSAKLPGGFSQFASLGWNIYTTLDYGDPTITTQMLSEMLWDQNTGVLAPYATNIAKDMKNDPVKIKAETDKIKAAIPNVGMEQFAEYVVNRDIDGPFPDYWYCQNNSTLITGTIPDPDPFTSPANRYGHGACWLKGLNGVHNVHNAALTAVDPRNGDILAMVGSVDYNSTDPRVQGQFNVATAPSRSLGSSFKPIVYATAFQMGWDPGIVMHDEPTCFPNDASSPTPTDQYLCPNNYLTHNYERQNWSGAQPITYELGNSLNTPAEMALSFAGVRADYTNDVYNMAQRLGIDTLDPRQMGPATALGAQGVPLLEETSAYGTFANNGYHFPPRSILTVTDPLGNAIKDGSGNQLFPYEAIPKHGGYQAISPEAAYMMTSVLTNNNARVGDFGPNNPLQFFGRDVAAKTGTSQNVVDIVTMGYTPWLSLGVWAGNADNSSMVDVIGIAGAGYIFHDVMQFAITRLHMPGTGPSNIAPQQPGGYFPIPKDMHKAIVSCHTGLAPYQGEDVTKECLPSNDPVPLFMTPEFNSSCDFDCDHVAPLKPNAAWYGLGWGSKKYEGNSFEQYPGINETWLINGQDPITP